MRHMRRQAGLNLPVPRFPKLLGFDVGLLQRARRRRSQSANSAATRRRVRRGMRHADFRLRSRDILNAVVEAQRGHQGREALEGRRQVLRAPTMSCACAASSRAAARGFSSPRPDLRQGPSACALVVSRRPNCLPAAWTRRTLQIPRSRRRTVATPANKARPYLRHGAAPSERRGRRSPAAPDHRRPPSARRAQRAASSGRDERQRRGLYSARVA